MKISQEKALKDIETAEYHLHKLLGFLVDEKDDDWGEVIEDFLENLEEIYTDYEGEL